jgi:hypothetical protein
MLHIIIALLLLCLIFTFFARVAFKIILTIIGAGVILFIVGAILHANGSL